MLEGSSEGENLGLTALGSTVGLSVNCGDGSELGLTVGDFVGKDVGLLEDDFMSIF